MNVQKQARRDAKEFARAQMFYGEGAGTRRKLIAATVQGKASSNPEYGRAFSTALAREDMAEHAARARREREARDRSEKINKNVRGLATGNYQSLSTGVMVVAVVGYLAHQTGWDKALYEKGKKAYNDFRFRRQAKRDFHLITNENQK